MARINLDELKKEDEIRNKHYVWLKPLIIGGRIIKSLFQGNNKKEIFKVK